MLNLKQEALTFKKLNYEEKLEKVEKWVSELSYHYDFFRDLEVDMKTHTSELNEEFIDATFQIILHLAKKLEKA